jgi:hypothetical protein
MQSTINISQVTADRLLRKEELEIDINLMSGKLQELTDRFCRLEDREEEIRRWEQKLLSHYRKLTLTEQEVADFVGIDLPHLKELFAKTCVPFSFTYFPSSPRGDYNFVTLEAMAQFIVRYTEKV